MGYRLEFQLPSKKRRQEGVDYVATIHNIAMRVLKRGLQISNEHRNSFFIKFRCHDDEGNLAGKVRNAVYLRFGSDNVVVDSEPVHSGRDYHSP